MRLWRRSKSPSSEPWTPTTAQKYPAGTCVITPSGRYMILKDGKRYKITTDAVFNSWSFPLVVETSDVAVSDHPLAFGVLPFRDGTLLNNIADGTLYLVSEGKLRHIIDPFVFTRLGVSKEAAVVVSDAEIKMMKLGEPIS